MQQVGIRDIVRDRDERKEEGELKDAGTELWSRKEQHMAIYPPISM
jgi:hypothetical protein